MSFIALSSLLDVPQMTPPPLKLPSCQSFQGGRGRVLSSCSTCQVLLTPRDHLHLSVRSLLSSSRLFVWKHGGAAHRPGEAEADQRAGHRRARRCGGDQAELQPTPSLHPGEGPERRHSPGLLLRPGPHRPGPPGGPLDPHPAVLLRDGPQGRSSRSSLLSDGGNEFTDHSGNNKSSYFQLLINDSLHVFLKSP